MVRKPLTGKQEDRYITEANIADFGIKCIKEYATEVNLDRAVPDIYDGFKPVQRRIIWAMSFQKRGELVKTARVGGDVVGKYHPHGDAGVAGSIETLVHQNTPLVQGTGNWGGLLDPCAAPRYTNCSLSNFGWDCLDPNYVAVIDLVPNYDGKDKEPVTLPVKLPVVLLNGSDGIGVGITTKLPTFTAESVVEVLTSMFQGKKINYEYLAKTLKPALLWGGALVNNAQNKQEWLNLMKTGRGRIEYFSPLEVDEKTRSIKISEWPPGLNPETFIKRVRAIPQCARAFNSKGSLTFTIEARRDCNGENFKTFVSKIEKLTHVRQSYRMNVTYRVANMEDGVTTFDTKFLSLGVGKLLVQWSKLRLSLEAKSLDYRIAKQQALVDRSKLLIFACNHLKTIFESLKQRDSQSYLVEHLKISEEQAKIILELKVRQLSRLDKEALEALLKEQIGVLNTFKGWLKNPKPKIIQDFKEALENILKDRVIEGKRKIASYSVH